MVKRYYKYGAGLLLVLTLALAAGAWWLLATTGGARWLVRQAPAALTVQQVEGRLCGPLRLVGIEASGPTGALAIEQLQITWQPAALLRGKLLVSELSAAGLTLTSSPSSPQTAADKPAGPWLWPELPGWLRWLQAEIQQLGLQRLSWQRPGQPPLTLEQLAGRLKWTGSRLEVRELTLSDPAGELVASLEARWGQPLLRLTMNAQLKDVAGAPAGFDLTLELQPANDREGFAGEVRLAANSAPSGALELAAQLELDSQGVSMRTLQLRPVGAKGRVDGELSLGWATDPLQVAADLVVAELDLAPFAGQVTDLSGTLQLTGSIDDYRGEFALTNRADDWQALRLTSGFAGNRQQLTLTQLDAGLLKGQLQGEMTAAWQPELRVAGQFSGHNLDPSAYHGDWPGTVNLEIAGSWRRPVDQPMELAVKGRLLDSLLRGYPLRGRIDASLQGNELELAALELQGQGVSLEAQGTLRKRVDFQARVEDLATLVPQASGVLNSSGWLRWRDRQLTGAVQGNGGGINFHDLQVKSVSFAASQRTAQGAGELSLQVEQFQRAGLPPIDGRLQASGTADKHQASATLRLAPDTAIELRVAGAYQQERWQGTVQQLVLQDKAGPWRLLQPVAVALSAQALQFDRLQLQGPGAEELTADADLQLQPFSGQLHAQWQDINLARANPWLAAIQLSGQASGQAALRWHAGAAPDLSARLDLHGRLVQDRLSVGLQRVTAELDWNRSGLTGKGLVELDQGGRLEGACHSAAPAAAQLPDSGQWQLNWQALDLGRLQIFLPAGLTAEGRLAGEARGSWASGGVLTATGSAAVEGGRLVGVLAESQISLLLKTGRFDWDWQDRYLQGEVSLVLEEYGRLAGRFNLPLSARLPLAFDPQGPLNASLAGQMRETGLIPALFPGVLQETRGQVEIDLTATGQWQKPLLRGRLQLVDAGAYVPSAGIELRDIVLDAELAGDEVRLTNLALQSGTGSLHGQGVLRLANWRPVSYQATLEGEGVQLVNLPELQLLVTPRLSLQGTPAGMTVSGTVTVPEMLLRGVEQSALVNPSEDVIIVGQELPAEPLERFALKANIGLLLGEHVLLQARGLDARLTGGLDLTIAGLDQMRAKGLITVAEGSFNAHGAKLDIQRGQVLFNGPVEAPTLDILAIRTVRKVKAGVRVTGTPQAPNITLYSEPAMPDSDRLAYIVLGRPFARNSGEADMMMTAAGVMLSEGESVVLQDRLKRQLGLDALGFEAGDDEGDVAASMLTIGKYLSPNLYVSIGQSLFTETSEFRMRYSLGENWEVESTTGTESGVDLFYKIEFR